MTRKPAKLAVADDLASHVKNTMKRNGEAFPASMREQVAKMIAFYLRKKMVGDHAIHPGMYKMGVWGACSERQARRNFAILRNHGFVELTAYPKGGRRATRFVLNFEALRRLLIVTGTNPSAALCKKLSSFAGGYPDTKADKNPDMNPDKSPDKCPDMMSAGIQVDMSRPTPTEKNRASRTKPIVPTHRGEGRA